MKKRLAKSTRKFIRTEKGRIRAQFSDAAEQSEKITILLDKFHPKREEKETKPKEIPKAKSKKEPKPKVAPKSKPEPKTKLKPPKAQKKAE